MEALALCMLRSYTQSEGEDIVEIDQLSQCTGFEWHEGNFEKNWIRQNVSRLECEQVFLNHALVVVATGSGIVRNLKINM